LTKLPENILKTRLPLVRDFDAELANSKTLDAAMDVLLAFAVKLGFEVVSYIYAPQMTASDEAIRPPHVLRIKPEADQFDRIYACHKYYRHDPIYQASLQTTLPIYWSFKNKNLLNGVELLPSEELAEMKKKLVQFGYFHGITVPLHLPNQKLVSIGMMSRGSYRQFVKVARSCSDVVMVLAHHFHERVFQMLPDACVKEDCRRLSPREIECLYWVAQGLTSPRIADQLQIADVTVRFHLKNAAAKLSAVNRAHAVAKATQQGLIIPSARPRPDWQLS